jgi:hypothetical protein
MGKQTLFSLRVLGYCLLFLFLLDISVIAIPPKFTDAFWELNLLGQIIERIPLLLLCFPLIFLEEYIDRKQWEGFVVKIISWSCIAISIFLFLSIPLTVLDTLRVQDIRHSELIVRSSQQTFPSEKVVERLGQANSDSEIRNVLGELTPNQKNEVNRIADPQKVKKDVLKKITDSIAENQYQLDIQKRRITISLWKNSVKWLIGELVSALFLLYIWNQSKWARLKIRYDQ